MDIYLDVCRHVWRTSQRHLLYFRLGGGRTSCFHFLKRLQILVFICCLILPVQMTVEYVVQS